MSSIIISEPITPELIWRLSVDNYHTMIETGILKDDDPVELLEGWLILKMPKNPPHRLVTGLTRTELERLIPTGWYVDSQEPITLADSEPEPDLVVVRGERRDYFDRHPGVKDIALVIEVADATLQRDRTLKQGIYARSGIPIYWIINLIDEQIEVYTQPSEKSGSFCYEQREDYKRSQLIPITIEGEEIGKLLGSVFLP